MNLSDELAVKTQRQLQWGSLATGLSVKYTLQAILNKLRNAEPKLICGKVNLKTLSANTRFIKTLDIEKDGIKIFEKLCKKYGVMYNIFKDKTNNDIKFTVFYREEDSERIQNVLSKMVSDIKKDIAQTKDNYEVNPITKKEIEKIQNKFENILNEVTEKEASLDCIVDNSVEGIADLTKVKSKIKEPLEEKINKAKEVKAKTPSKAKTIKKPLIKAR